VQSVQESILILNKTFCEFSHQFEEWLKGSSPLPKKQDVQTYLHQMKNVKTGFNH